MFFHELSFKVKYRSNSSGYAPIQSICFAVLSLLLKSNNNVTKLFHVIFCLLFSIAPYVCLDPPILFASSCCDNPTFARNTGNLFVKIFINSSLRVSSNAQFIVCLRLFLIHKSVHNYFVEH